MTTAHGIYEYDGSELGAPGPDYMALLTDSIEQALADVDDDLANLDLLTDSGWVNITTFGTGWSAVGGYQPRVRRVGSHVELGGAVIGGATAVISNILTIPVGFRMTGAYPQQFLSAIVTSSGHAATLLVSAGQTLGIPGGYHNNGIGANGVVIPLAGSWWVD